MDPDIAIVLAVIFAALAFPALLSAFSEGRQPRAAAILIVLAAGLAYWAVTTKPSGYDLDDIPSAFVRVVGMIMN